MAQFQFRKHFVGLSLPRGCYAQTALADLDGDGVLEYIVGRQYGEIYCYKMRTLDEWDRYRIGEDSPSDVGLCVHDVDGDGRPDLVTGGAWYRNTGDLSKPFERIVFDPDLTGVHDILAADIDGDGRNEILVMADRHDVRWYRIPDDPTQAWPQQHVGPAVHAGLAVGDLNGNGHLDIVRTNVWFENVNGDGRTWAEHRIGPNTPPPPDFQKPFAFDATRSRVCDINGNGFNDIVFSDAEIPGAKLWWMENVDGKGLQWRRHEIADPDPPVRRAPLHSLFVGDLDGDGDLDVLSCEMEAIRGGQPPRWLIWENVDGKGGVWKEHVILDENLGGHEAVVGDVTGSGKPDVIAKPWRPHPENAVGGEMFVLMLENVSTGMG